MYKNARFASELVRVDLKSEGFVMDDNSTITP